MPYRLVTLKRSPLVFQPEHRAQRTTTKGIGQHLPGMPNDEPRIVEKGRGHMANLHPALSLPAKVLDLFRRYVLRADDRGGTVVFFEPLIHNQAALAELFRHGRLWIRCGVLDVGPVHVAAGGSKGGLSCFPWVVLGFVRLFSPHQNTLFVLVSEQPFFGPLALSS